jgi:hypothetical protein
MNIIKNFFEKRNKKNFEQKQRNIERLRKFNQKLCNSGSKVKVISDINEEKFTQKVNNFIKKYTRWDFDRASRIDDIKYSIKKLDKKQTKYIAIIEYTIWYPGI